MFKLFKLKFISMVFGLALAVIALASTLLQPEIQIPERGTVSKAAGTTRIMSFNLRCDSASDIGDHSSKVRRPLACQLIGEYLPDSVGVQECTYSWFKGLQKYLPEYEIVGVGRENGTQNKLCGEMSAILYLKDQYNLVDSGTFWLSDTPDTPSRGWDGACKRICTWAVLENKETGAQYAHINTHLDHIGPEARTKGLAMVLDKVLSFDMPAVLTGDFNFHEGTDLYKQLTGNGLTDTKYAAAETMNGFSFHGYKPESTTDNRPIDFICVNSSVKTVNTYKILQEKIDGKLVSDHYPLCSDMILY